MQNTAVEKRMERGVFVGILILPFILFYWMTPPWSERNIGQDYVLYAPMYQMELMFSIKSGSFPLYIPGFFGGQSSSALTMGEVYHPLAHLAAIMPGYWTGQALKWNTFFRLLSLGWAHLALFVFIRKFPIRIWMAFLFSTITVYNMRTLALFNYGCSLETWTGFLVLCAGIGLYAFHISGWRYPLLMIGAGYWMITSGHPQMMYYGLLGALLTAVLIPFYIGAILPARRMKWEHRLDFWLRVGLCLAASIALASAYVLPFYFDFVTTNAGRADQGYAWAAEYYDSLAGTLNNFFNPLRSGTSMFGGSPFFLYAALLPLLRMAGIRIPVVIWSIWSVFVLMFLHIQGPRLPVHHLAWKYLPFASTFREPGRIAMLIPFFLLLLLIWATASPARDARISIRRISLPAPVFPAIAVFVSMLAYVLLPRHLTAHPDAFCPVNVLNLRPWVEVLIMVFSGAILILWVSVGRRDFQACRFGVLLCAMTVASLTVQFRFGIWIDKNLPTPTYESMRKEKQEGLYYRPHPGEGYKHRVVVRQLRESFLEPCLGKVFYRFETAEDNDAAYRRMARGRTMDLAVVEGVSSESIGGGGKSVKTYAERAEHDHVDLDYSAFNRLVFDVSSGESAFFGMGYPFTGHWKAYLDGRSTPIYRVNGAAHAVWIPEGSSRIEFRYYSRAAMWGMALGMTTFGVLGVMIGWTFRRHPSLKILAAISVALGIIGFLLWRQSLYAGENLGTRYHWTPPPEKALSNLAYGKPTTMSSHIRFHPYFYGSCRGVDGDRHTPYGFVTQGSCFITGRQKDPWWQVDLRHPAKVSSIHVSLSLFGEEWNRSPLTLAVSEDGVGWEWKDYHRLTAPGELAVKFQVPRRIRYVKILAAGYCRLALDEVEVYPPAGDEER